MGEQGEGDRISPAGMIVWLASGKPLVIMAPDFGDPGRYVARPVDAVLPADVGMGDGSGRRTSGRHLIYFGGQYRYPLIMATYPPTTYTVVRDVESEQGSEHQRGAPQGA